MIAARRSTISRAPKRESNPSAAIYTAQMILFR
jgi:hypothetical protein